MDGSPPAVALSRADRGEEDSSTDEPNSGSGYARMKPAAADWSAVNGSAHNANVISFGTATGGAEVQGDVSHFVLYGSAAGEPCSAGYWALWNSCAPDNRAHVAAANGGRAAGWILMDDLLADPGIQLGEHPVTSCEEGLAILKSEDGDRIQALAGAMLVAQVNLSVGAESRPVAEQAVGADHVVLAYAEFDGPDDDSGDLSNEVASAVPPIVELLTAYNRGELCV